jgi:AcrR family transcriptional regulator
MSSERITAKRAALRHRIIEVAVEAFAARGFDATTTNDIADTLQMTGPSLYYYFRTKEELLFACMEYILERLHADVAAAAGSQGTPLERMAQVLRTQLKIELGSGGAASLVNAHLYGPQYLTQVLSPERQDALRLRQRELIQIFRTLIDEGIASGHFVVTDTRVAAFNVLAVVQYSGVWYRPRKGQRLADLIDAQTAAALQLLGVSPAPAGPVPKPESAPATRPARKTRK